MDITAAQIARFHSYVDRTNGPLACWPWTRGRTSLGYGYFHLSGKMVTSTHIALTLDGRPRPQWKPGALHTCHYTPCCNPLHLYWGTQTDNMRDALEAGRLSEYKETPHGSHKLTEEQVYIIRAMYDANMSSNHIAKRMKISRNTAWRIGTRQAGKHLPERKPSV